MRLPAISPGTAPPYPFPAAEFDTPDISSSFISCGFNRAGPSRQPATVSRAAEFAPTAARAGEVRHTAQALQAPHQLQFALDSPSISGFAILFFLLKNLFAVLTAYMRYGAFFMPCREYSSAQLILTGRGVKLAEFIFI
jgi:hypothetical protein